MEKETDLTEFDRIRKDLDSLIVDGKYIGEGAKEANTEPLLFSLLHNTVDIDTNDVKHFIRQYSKNKKRADFCIKFSNGIKVLLELKPWDESPSKKKWQKQVEKYMTEMPEVDFAIISNGHQMHFYKREIRKQLFYFLNIDMDNLEKRELNITRLQHIFSSNFEDLPTIYQWGAELKNEEYNTRKHTDDLDKCGIIIKENKNEKEEQKPFIKHSNEIMRFGKSCFGVNLTSDDAKLGKVLLGWNIINMFGVLSEDGSEFSHQSINMQKMALLVKHCSFIYVMHFWKNDEIQNYIIRAFSILGIDVKTKVKFWSINSIRDLNQKKITKMRFDIAILNPPYSRDLYIKILSNLIINAKINQMIWVAPYSWVTSKYRSDVIKDAIGRYYSKITIIYDNQFFDAEIPLSAIVYIDFKQFDNCLYINEEKYENLDSITPCIASGDKYFRLLPELSLKLCKKNKSLEDLLYSIHDAELAENEPILFKSYTQKRTQDNDVPICVIPHLAGSNGFNKSKAQMSIMSPDISERENCIRMYKEFRENHGKKLYYITTKSLNESRKIQKYLMTDFARMFLTIAKDSIQLIANDNRPLKYVPTDNWDNPIFDKTVGEINAYLFKEYVPDSEIRCGLKRSIEKYLPNIYDIERDEEYFKKA